MISCLHPEHTRACVLPMQHRMSFWFDDIKTRGAAERCRRSQTVKEKLSPHFWVFGIFEGVLLHAQMTPRPVQHGGRVELDPVLPVDPKPLVLRVRANCGGRELTNDAAAKAPGRSAPDPISAALSKAKESALEMVRKSLTKDDLE